ncbi:MAG TPA: helicase-exonuclease AddAB subunit AddA [Haloplasmataceae bacterium]
MKFTKEQLQAINSKGKNLLVSASAGSGKTTVLIERIMEKMKKDQVNIDELLIVTFTEKAASELKLRLRLKLNKELLENPYNSHLRKQLPKIANSHISTFHAFCNEVIKKFFYLIDFDATYSIADDVEAKLIASETLEELFNECFEKENKDFLLLVNRFSTKTNDENFRNIIMTVYNKIKSLPYYEQFKKKTLENYDVNNNLNTWKCFAFIKEIFINILSEAKSYFAKAYHLAKSYNHPYCELYQADSLLVNNIENMLDESWDNLFHYFRKLKFSPFKSSSRDLEIDDITKELIKSYRDKGKDLITNKLSMYFAYYEKSHVKFLKENRVILESLFALIELFDEKYHLAKKDKNLVDFNDLETLTLQILTSQNGNNEAVKYYRGLFKEILIDEFQDTNSMQEAIINYLSCGNNVFMVGDVKQSIYRFRNAEPDIFQRKYKEFSQGLGGELINLNANYRSRKEIIDFINFLFQQLMDEENFEIEYDDRAQLVFGQKDYLESKLKENFVNLCILDKAKINESMGEHLDKGVLEAHFVACEIRRLIDNGYMLYDSKEKLRPIEYRDIVILARTKHEQSTYYDVFKKYNIPFLASELTGYFDSIEVLTVTSILKVIDNPLQDIPLVATLRSPIFNINEKELIEIKVNSKEDYFYHKVIEYLKSGKNEIICDKLRYFISMLDKWRENAKTLAVPDIIYSIYHETNYYDFVLGQSGGIQRKANLDLLYTRAKQYEHLITNSLFKFIQLINFFQDNDEDLPQARTLSDNENLVQFMTIHKAKGLEFPVVFVTNLDKKYNTQDEKNAILFDKDLGIGFSYLDMKYRVRYQTLMQNLIKDKLHRELLAEEMRLLYVALTRAKEYLYLVGTVEDFAEEIPKLRMLTDYTDKLLPKDERLATNYLELILKAMSRHNAFKRILGISGKGENPQCQVRIIDSSFALLDDNPDKLDYELDFSKYAKEISQRLNFVYPHYEYTVHFAKQTIADIKRQQNMSEYLYQHGKSLFKKPRFLSNSTIDPTLKGTSFHIFMQHVDYTKDYTYEKLEDLKSSLILKEVLSEEQAQLIDLMKILNLLDQDLMKSIKYANKVYKEMPFTTLLSSKKVYPHLKDEVDILVQGVVDLFVEYDTYCVLVDFKTDYLNNNDLEISRIKNEYQLQLSIYKEAMEKIYANKKIVAYLYLFAIDKFISM